MFSDPWTLQVAQEILTGEFIVLELQRIITMKKSCKDHSQRTER